VTRSEQRGHVRHVLFTRSSDRIAEIMGDVKEKVCHGAEHSVANFRSDWRLSDGGFTFASKLALP